jgi:hypothetical protein
MTTNDAAFLIFSAVNVARLLAYLPQIVAIARDTTGAAAISNLSWLLFGLSHLSTAIYAGLVLHDPAIVLAFLANTACCLAVVGLTLYKRQRWARLVATGEAPPAAA